MIKKLTARLICITWKIDGFDWLKKTKLETKSRAKPKNINSLFENLTKISHLFLKVQNYTNYINTNTFCLWMQCTDVPMDGCWKSERQSFQIITVKMHNRFRRLWYSTLHGKISIGIELFKVCCLLASGCILTRYCNIKGSAIVGSIFPTITTVKAEGSLKHLLKYSQASRGSTFCRSHFLIGCITNIRWKSKVVYSVYD